jgi:methyl-accepting chemotaxis protein
MRRFYDIRIKRKLTLIIIAVMTVSFTISAMVIGIYRYREDRAVIEHHLGVLASAIGANCSAALVFDDETAALEVLSALQSDHSITCAVLSDENSTKLASFGSCDPAHDAQTADKAEHGEVRVDQRIVADGKTVGYLTIWGRTSEVTERMANDAVISVTAFVVGVIFIMMMLDRTLALLNAPLIELHETMRRALRARDYSVRANKVADDEIGDVAVAFNQLMDQIEQAGAMPPAPMSQPTAPVTAALSPEPDPATFKS